MVNGVSSLYDGASSTTLTFAHTVKAGPNSCLVVAVGESRLRTISVTYNSISLTQATYISRGSGGSGEFGTVYYLVNPPKGTYNVVITYSSALTERLSGAVNIYGVNQLNPIGAIQTTSGTATGNKSLNITTQYNNSIIIDAFGSNDLAHTAGAGQITVFNGGNRRMSYKIIGAAGSQSLTYTVPSGTSNYAWAAVEIRSAAT